MQEATKAKVNKIGLREKQGRELVFTDRIKETFDWSYKVPIDGP